MSRLGIWSTITLTALLLLLPLAPAPTIIGGTEDGTAHPYVGAIDGRVHGRGFGSGVLVSPTVYVTAGHATKFFDDAGLTRARVTFAPDARDPSRPSTREPYTRIPRSAVVLAIPTTSAWTSLMSRSRE